MLFGLITSNPEHWVFWSNIPPEWIFPFSIYSSDFSSRELSHFDIKFRTILVRIEINIYNLFIICWFHSCHIWIDFVWNRTEWLFILWAQQVIEVNAGYLQSGIRASELLFICRFVATSINRNVCSVLHDFSS